MKANNPPATMEPRICGRVMVRKAVQRLAPRLRAASSWLKSYCYSPDETVTTTKGIARIVCAIPRPGIVFTTPSRT